MGETSLRWLRDEAGLQFEGFTAYGLPVLIGGEAGGAGAKPSDLLPVSLAACTAYDVVVILRKQRQELRDLEVRITSEQDPEPPWTFRRIRLHFIITGDVDGSKARKAIALSESKYCAVAASIRPTVAIELSCEIVSA